MEKLTAAALRVGLFLLMVGVITTGLIALLKARAALDAQAEFYTATPPETHLASSSARPAVLSGTEPKTAVGELLTGSITVLPSEQAAIASRDVRGAGHDDQPGELSESDTGKGENAHLATITIRRGRNSVSSYTVPRE